MGLRATCLERKTLLEKPATLLRCHFLSTGKENERKRLGSPTVNEKDYQDEAGKDSLKSCLNQFRSSDERDASRKEKIEKLIDRQSPRLAIQIPAANGELAPAVDSQRRVLRNGLHGWPPGDPLRTGYASRYSRSREAISAGSTSAAST